MVEAGRTYTGNLRNWNTAGGYGFVACPEVEEYYGVGDVYLHSRALEFNGVDPSQVYQGMPLKFELHFNPAGKPQATNPMPLAKGKGKGKPTTQPPVQQQKTSVPAAWAGGAWQVKKPAPGKSTAAVREAGAEVVAALRPSELVADDGSPMIVISLSKLNRLMVAAGLDPVADPNIPEAPTGEDQEQLAEPAHLLGGMQDDEHELPHEEPGLNDEQQQMEGADARKEQAFAIDFPPTSYPEDEGDDGQEPPEDSFFMVNDPASGNANSMIGKGCPWFNGVLKKYFQEEHYGIIDSEGVREQYKKDCSVQGEHLDPGSTGKLIVQEGEEVMFPLVEDEEANLWAWEPIIPKTREFTGTIRLWNGTHQPGFGFIKCDELGKFFDQDVYLHGGCAKHSNVAPAKGQKVVFNLHVSKEGRPQASSPKLAVGSTVSHAPLAWAQPGNQPMAKRPRMGSHHDPDGSCKGGGTKGWGGKWQAPQQWGNENWSGGGAGGGGGGGGGGKGAWFGKGAWNGDAEWSSGNWSGAQWGSGQQQWGSGAQWGSGGSWDGKGIGKKRSRENDGDEQWFTGTLKTFEEAKCFGFIDSIDARSVYGTSDVYIHQSVMDQCGASLGSQLTFKIHRNKQGKPQASSPCYIVS